MINAVVDRSVTEQLREALDKAISDGAYSLVQHTTERAAGRVQGLNDALAMLNSIIERQNNERSARDNPQQRTPNGY